MAFTQLCPAPLTGRVAAPLGRLGVMAGVSGSTEDDGFWRPASPPYGAPLSHLLQSDRLRHSSFTGSSRWLVHSERMNPQALGFNELLFCRTKLPVHVLLERSRVPSCLPFNSSAQDLTRLAAELLSHPRRGFEPPTLRSVAVAFSAELLGHKHDVRES